MKVRFKIAVAGAVHGRDGVVPGDILDVPDDVGARYCRYHYAEPVVDTKEERAVAPSGEERAEPAKKTAPKTAPKADA